MPLGTDHILSGTPATHDLQRKLHAAGRYMADGLRSKLFLMTTISALNGQVTLLAADGRLATPTAVVVVAMTVIAGAGAFLAATQEGDLQRAEGRRRFLATAGLSVLVNVAAAALGAFVVTHLATDHLRPFAAAALGLVAVEIALGRAVRLPLGVPAPFLFIVLGIAAEVLL